MMTDEQRRECLLDRRDRVLTLFISHHFSFINVCKLPEFLFTLFVVEL